MISLKLLCLLIISTSFTNCQLEFISDCIEDSLELGTFSEFIVIDEKLTFDNATERCLELNGLLARVSSEDEFSFLDTFVNVLSDNTDSIWIGLNGSSLLDLADPKSYFFVDGKLDNIFYEVPKEKPWNGNQPSIRSEGVSQCIEWSRVGIRRWTAHFCTNLYKVLCRRICSSKTKSPTKSPTKQTNEVEDNNSEVLLSILIFLCFIIIILLCVIFVIKLSFRKKREMEKRVMLINENFSSSQISPSVFKLN